MPEGGDKPGTATYPFEGPARCLLQAPVVFRADVARDRRCPIRHLRLRIFDGRQLLRGFDECVALLRVALAARGQSTQQAEWYGA